VGVAVGHRPHRRNWFQATNFMPREIRIACNYLLHDIRCRRFGFTSYLEQRRLFHTKVALLYMMLIACSQFLFCACQLNPSTPELNPSAQRCLTRFLLGSLLLEPSILKIYALKTNKYTNYSFSLLITYGSSYMFRHYIAIFRERS
jgi:hypothetical protein